MEIEKAINQPRECLLGLQGKEDNCTASEYYISWKKLLNWEPVDCPCHRHLDRSPYGHVVSALGCPNALRVQSISYDEGRSERETQRTKFREK